MKWVGRIINQRLLLLLLLLISFAVSLSLLTAQKTQAFHHPDHTDLTEKGLLLDRQGFYPWADVKAGVRQNDTMANCGCMLAAFSTVINYMLPGNTPWFAPSIRHPNGTTFTFNRHVSPPYIDEFLRNGDHQAPVTPNWGFPKKAINFAPDGCGIPIPRATALERIVQPNYVFDETGNRYEVGDTGIVFGAARRFDSSERSLAQSWLRDDKPVIAAYTFLDDEGKRRGHTVVIVGFNPEDGKFRVVDPMWDSFYGGSAVPGSSEADPDKAYNDWEESIVAVLFPTTVNTRHRYFEVRDDPAHFEMLSTSPEGQRAGIDEHGIEYKEDQAITDITHDDWNIPTEELQPGPPVRNIYIRNPKPGPYRLQFVAKQDTQLKLELVDTPPGDRSNGNHVLTVDEPMAKGEILKYEMGYTGIGAATATQVESFAPFAKAGNDTNGLTGMPIPFHGETSTDPDSTIVQHSWDFGDGTSALGANPEHTYLEPGNYTATLTVTDDAGRTATDSRLVRIVLSQQKPIARVNGPHIATASLDVSISASESFDRNGDPLTYKWDFGDGTTTTTSDDSLDHKYAGVGEYEVTVVVNDGHEDSLPAKSSVKVIANQIKALSVPSCVNPGTTASISLDNHRDQISWDLSSDPVPPPRTVEEAQAEIDRSGSFGGEYGRPVEFGAPIKVEVVKSVSEFQHSLIMTWQVPHDYAAGNHNVGFRSEALSGTFRKTIVSPCPIPDNLAPAAHAGGPQYTATAGRPLTLDGSRSSDPDGDPITYRWDLGDGETASGVQPSHTYPNPGTYYVMLQVNDGVHNSGTSNNMARVTVTEGSPNTPPRVNAGTDTTGIEGSPLQLNGTAQDPDNEPLTHSWSYEAKEGMDMGTVCQFSDPTAVSSTFTCTDDGIYEIKLTASDGQTSTADTALVSVANVSPVIGNVEVPISPAPMPTTAQATATFTDAGANDTPTATWDWGDGTTSSATILDKTVSDSHQYLAAGVYVVCLKVVDDDAAEGTGCSLQRVVVYDPNNGFVTGGGWIDSPPRAYTPGNFFDPEIVGRTNFGFVAKHKNQSTAPTGSTEFQFKNGNLNFHSSSYEWLMVSGSKAILSGSGQVNNQGNYKFIVSIIDGSPDKFRIKIWGANSQLVLYDNQSGASHTADAVHAINNGSIVIHKD